MRWTIVIPLIAIAAVAGCTIPGNEERYEVATMALPQGDADAGQDAFVSLGCASCHRVTKNDALPEPIATADAPELGVGQAGYSAGMLATSIISPSHHVSTEFATRSEDGRSPMADFTGSMTVRQMIDIVAFLRQSGGASDAGANYVKSE